MDCALYQADRCHSCQWITQPLAEQRLTKLRDLQTRLAGYSVREWRPTVGGASSAFRNKAKMVVSGSVERPILGMLSREGEAQDLTSCPLYPSDFLSVFTALKPFIARAGLTPYDVIRRRGELKYLLLTRSQQHGHFMLRFVLRSTKKLAQLQAALPELLRTLPALRVVSANIQPVHMAVLEGDEEIPLTEEQSLAECFNGVPLHILPQSFFQTNPEVAALLYATAREWISPLGIKSMWDLFCGVGGFGLHCATPEMALTGIEIVPAAIRCATRSARELGFTKVTFKALDSAAFALSQDAVPDLILVNPPRRGLGSDLCVFLQKMRPTYLLYSSCNAQTMAADIGRLTDYQISQIQLFDMFPHTAHYEVLTLLTLK